MKLPIDLLLLSLTISQTAASPIQPNLEPRGASFSSLQGLTKLSYDFSSSQSFSHPTKFFHESTFSPHYDGRFADTELSHTERIHHLRWLLKSYMDTMQKIGVRTWIMHGCLLGWWWNRKIMPWDTDIDVMVDEDGMDELGNWWNMTVHAFTGDDLILPDTNEHIKKRNLYEDVAKHGKKYLLEVNPYSANMSTKDKENVIDARWIDTSTGLFIDITTIHVQPVADAEDQEVGTEEDRDVGLYTKDQHAYSYSQMFPLRLSIFEGILVRIPYDYEGLLLDEYGPKSMTHKWYKGWQFDQEQHEWIATGEAEEVPSPSEQQRIQADKAQHAKILKEAGKNT